MRTGLLGVALLAFVVAVALFGSGSTTGHVVVDQWMEHRDQHQEEMHSLQTELKTIVSNSPGYISIYIEDLQSGAQIGVNANETYPPNSLFKLPTAIAVLKEIEDQRLTFEQEHVINQDEIDSRFGVLFFSGSGNSFTTQELLEASMIHSDNTANNALRAAIPFERIEDARLATGIRLPRQQTSIYTISPKEYANVLRSLYTSTYLREPFSSYLLDLLAQSAHNDLLPSGFPQETKIAHKIGVNHDRKEFHDCGIVYLQNSDYLVCVMTGNISQEDARALYNQIGQQLTKFDKKQHAMH